MSEAISSSETSPSDSNDVSIENLKLHDEDCPCRSNMTIRVIIKRGVTWIRVILAGLAMSEIRLSINGNTDRRLDPYHERHLRLPVDVKRFRRYTSGSECF